ncbi:MAG: hypothetical protein NZ741_12025, partial [Armatimonadetes bacterium]|nr:hypothetical protein [Armatimonadota bacterium]
VQWLNEEHGVELDLARRCALLSQGAPGRAWSLATQPQALKLWDALAELAYAITQSPLPAPALQLAERLRLLATVDITEEGELSVEGVGKSKTPTRGALLLALDALCAWFRDALWLACGGAPEGIVYQGEEGRLSRAASNLGAERLIRAINAVLDVRRAVEGNANIPLATEVLMMRLLERSYSA